MSLLHVSLVFQLGRHIGKPANARPVGDVDNLSDRVAGLGCDVSLSLWSYLFCPVVSFVAVMNRTRT
jgi:hypothetical protein